MLFQEPKVEFIQIKLNESVATVSLGFDAGGGQYCIGSMEAAIDCANWETFTPWD